MNWCVVGCSATYGLDLWAGFSYGFGLRFPIKTELKYHAVVHGNNSADASLTATFKPIQGTIDDFFSAGLSGDQIFNAQELVAQAGAHAGFDINLPGLNPSYDYKVGKDLTEELPAPFTNGTFTPPAPGVPSPPGQTIFDQIDLLGGLLNYGVVGGQLFPALEIALFSNELQFTLSDRHRSGQRRKQGSSRGRPDAYRRRMPAGKRAGRKLSLSGEGDAGIVSSDAEEWRGVDLRAAGAERRR